MANRCVADLHQAPQSQPTHAHIPPDANPLRQHKRKHTQTTSESTVSPKSVTTIDLVTENDSASENKSNSDTTKECDDQPQSKRQRKTVQSSGSRSSPPQSRPVEVIVIDSDSDEEGTHTSPKPAVPVDPVQSDPVREQQQQHPASRRPPITAAVMEQLESDDYFVVLGLSRDATEADVKRAYRKLAIQWHPDKNRDHPRAEEFFKSVGEAYAVLSDPAKRTIYERYGKPGLEKGGGSGDASSSSGAARPGSSSGGMYSDDPFGFHGGHHSGFSSRQARDIFEAFFGGVDIFEVLLGGGGGGRGGRGSSSSGRGRRASQQQQQHQRRAQQPFHDPHEGYEDHGFGFGPGGLGLGLGMPSMMMMGGGFGGSRRGLGGFGGGHGGLLDSFFSDEFPGFGNGNLGGGGGGFASHSVSTSSFTDRNGQTVTKKTTTTTNADGRSETITEEFRNGLLVNSSTSSLATNRLAGAGRMQLDS